MKSITTGSLIAALLFTLNSTAQQNFKPAVVYTLNGDTLSGSIDYRNWKNNPTAVTFRKNSTDQPVVYRPNDIAGFKVESDKYTSAEVEVDVRHDDVNKLSDVKEIVTKQASAFLLNIVSGNKSLYLYHDGLDHFYIKNKQEFELLEYKLYRGSEKQERRIETNTKYQEQLIGYLENCFQVQQDADDVYYKTSALRNLFTSYYECVKAAPEYVKPASKIQTHFGILAGITRVNLDFTGDQATISKAKFKGSTGYAVGAFFDVIFPRMQGRLSINNELLLVNQLSKGVWKTSYSPTIYDMNTYEVGHTSIRVGTMLRYRFLLKPATFYFNGGITNSFKLSEKSALIKFHKFEATETTTYTTVPHDYGKYEMGYLLGAGARFGKLGAELRLEKSSGMLYYRFVHSYETRYGVIIHYRLL